MRALSELDRENLEAIRVGELAVDNATDERSIARLVKSGFAYYIGGVIFISDLGREALARHLRAGVCGECGSEEPQAEGCTDGGCRYSR